MDEFLHLFLLIWITAQIGKADQSPDGCNATLSQNLSDHLFTSSSARDEEHAASASKSGRVGWIAGRSAKSEYLQLNFNRTVKITGLKIGETDNRWYSRGIRITFSDDSLVWTAYNSQDGGHILGETFEETSSKTIEIVLEPPVQAQYLAINPTSYSVYPCMTLEVYGCDVSTGTSTKQMTPVEQNIESDVVWIPSQSPYVIDTPITVGPETKLTIQAGVSVVFTSEQAGLDIYGYLETSESSGLETLFTSSHPVTSLWDTWKGIVSHPGARITLVHSTIRQAVSGMKGDGFGVRISNCLVHSCTNGILLSGGKESNSTDLANFDLSLPTISNTTVAFINYGLTLHGTSSKPLFVINRCTFMTLYVGIKIDNWDKTDRDSVATTLVVRESNVSDIKHTGLTSRSEASSLFIVNSRIYNNMRYGVYVDCNRIMREISIVNCSFADNYRGVYLRSTYCSVFDVSIQSNLFIHSTLSVTGISFRSGNGLVVVSENEFSLTDDVPLDISLRSSHTISVINNTFHSTKGGLKLSWSSDSTDVFANVSDNEFRIVHGENVILIAAENLRLTIDKNVIHNATATNMIHYGNGHVNLTDNELSENSQCTCYIKVDREYDGLNTIYADRNYWGTADVNEIKVKTCDFFFDSSKSRVLMQNAYTSSGMENTFDVSNYDLFHADFELSKQAYIVGGVILHSTDIMDQFQSYPVIVKRSVLIAENVTVALSGMTLNFTEKTGAVVHGSLSIGSEGGKPTILQADNKDGYWNGIQTFTPDISVINTQVSGCKVAFYPRRTLNININNSTIYGSDSLLQALHYTGNISLTIASSEAAVDQTLFRLSILGTEAIAITIQNSVLSSSQKNVLHLDENSSHKSLTSINLLVYNSTLIGEKTVIYIKSCDGVLVSNVSKSSLFSAQDVLFIESYTRNFGFYSNSLKDYRNGISFETCTSFQNKDKEIAEIYDNVFHSTEYGTDISFSRSWYDRNPSYDYKIANNTFEDYSRQNRIGIQVQDADIYKDLSISDSVFVKNNIFYQYDTAVKLSSSLKNCLIENNTVKDGISFIDANLRNFESGDVFIRKNNILNNTNSNGIIRVDQPLNEKSSFMITDNLFINNTGVMLSITSPNTSIQHNFFENKNAEYNIYVENNDKISHSKRVVNASFNFWGTVDDGAIASAIFDKDFDSSLLDVVFRPFLASTNISDIYNEESSFIRSSGDIGGLINGEIQLTSDGSPYRVVHNIDIKKSGRLTIEAGVELHFDQNVGINVQGVLIVNGSAVSPVLMKSYDLQTPWKGVQVTGNEWSVLKHVIVNSTLYGIVVRGIRTSLESVTSGFSSSHGITLNIADDISNTTETTYTELRAIDNSQTGILINIDPAVKNITMRVDGCTSFRNMGYGLKVLTGTTVSLHGCDIANNVNGLQLDQHTGAKTNVLSSEFTGNSGTALNVLLMEGAGFDLLTTINIVNNTFTNGSRVLKLRTTSTLPQDTGIQLSGNTLSYNTHGDGSLIDINITNIKGYLDMNYNMIMENKGVYLMNVNSSHNDIGLDVNITDNQFLSNGIQEAVLDIQAYTRLNIHRNILKNDFVACELRSPVLHNSTFHINATQNYWGSRRIGEIINKVCSFDSDMERAYVYYLPYFRDESLYRLEEFKHSMFDLSDAHGGEITDDLTLSAVTSYTIRRSIMIRKGSTLTVAKGITLMFDRGRGIYVEGGLKIIGEEDTVHLTNDLSTTYTWHGIVLQANADISMITNTWIENTEHGITTETDLLDMKGSVVLNSSRSCLTLRSDADRLHDFQGLVLRNCSKSGIELSGNGNVTIINVVVDNSDMGLVLNAESGRLALRSSNFSNITSTAISISFNDYSKSGNIHVEDCSVNNTARGIVVSVQNYRTHNVIRINRNVLTNIMDKALDVHFQSYWSLVYVSKSLNRTVDIGENLFQDSCGARLTLWGYSQASFHLNDIKGTSCNGGTDDLNYIDIRAYRETNITVSSNRFYRVIASAVVKLGGFRDNSVFTGWLNFNQYFDNRASKGVVVLDTSLIPLTQNIFESPMSLFDVFVEEKGNDVINASSNWWGSSDMGYINSRIYDKRRDETLSFLNVTPILTERIVDCSGADNCSSHGDCTGPDRCRCHSGWTGKKCDQFDCAGVNYCYGNGVCIGANQCQCSIGWSGPLCIVASCRNISNCNDHGICIRPNKCVCADRFTGEDCGTCKANHWGSSCRPCPNCNNGDCDLKNGECICHSDNWSGPLCDRCSEAFYGPQCLPLMMVLTIMPDEGPDTGGNLVHVRGHNFPEITNGSYTCMFGSQVVMGTWQAWNHVTCPAPRHPKGDVVVEISSNGITYTDNKLLYTFHGSCPPGSCGEDSSPARGQCFFGSCLCNALWTGTDCETALLPPVIRHPAPEQNATEAGSYTLSLSVEQGDAPVRWSLLAGPRGMVINQQTATLFWEPTVANSLPYIINVRVSNIAGMDSTEWKLMVPISYSAEVITISPSGDLPYPKPIHIKGRVVGDLGIPVPPNVIILQGNRVIRQITAETDMKFPATFSVTYYPQFDDAGAFSVMARHPASNTNGSTLLSWRVKGMRCEPNFIIWERFIDSDEVIYRNISSLVNTGGLPIHTISAQVDGLSGAYVKNSETSSISDPFITTLTETIAVTFDLVVSKPRPFFGTVLVMFASDEGLYSTLEVSIRLSVRKPLLSIEPQRLRESLIRGTQKLIDVHVSNLGDIPATDVKAEFPNDPRISLVSFTNADEKNNLNGLTIPPHTSAVMTISVIVESTTALGELVGQIAINTNLTSDYIAYTFYITSVQNLTLNVTVTDEYTYFASDSPHVAGAVVKLWNPRRGYKEERVTTNKTGYVLFEDIYEDRYTLNVHADGHSSYSAIIVTSPDKVNFEAFLKRTAVKYEWTVTPTLVKDEYIITLESTFETFVPMPVVTIEPARVDTLPHEIGQKDHIEFNITNHGLIRANNVRLALPSSLPYLILEPTNINIGNLEANTTVLVLVKSTPRSRPTRAANCNAGRLVYEITCGAIRTYGRGVDFTRGGTSGSCGGWFGGRGSPIGGSIGGYSSVYASSTPLSCDCLVTFIKSCMLAFHPVAGCAMAIQGLEQSGSGGNQGVVKSVLPIMDYVMGCLSNFIPYLKPLGTPYTALRCIMDVKEKCGNGRNRREANSDVVTNLQNTARSIDNFVIIVNEITGDEQFYSINSTWYGTFKTSLTDNSDGGILISQDEFATTVDTISIETEKDTLKKFLHRWNDTVSAWENGTLIDISSSQNVINLPLLTPRLDQYVRDTDVAKDKGFSSIFDEFNNAVSAYQTAEASKTTSSKKDGAICAKVRIRIVQELVLTRSAFIAKLEMENGENHALEDINLEIQIRQTGLGGELENHKFSIGAPTLIGISAVDGTGTLGRDLSGSAEWLIIPYTSAAPVDDIQYDIGGHLAYRVGSSDFSTILLPDTVTVKSNPSLTVRYFHEKFVRGDDPLTKVIEPVVPFSLCVSVMNAGYGIANALKITSGQPEIIENEKGLLVSFKIIGAFLQGKPITPSLSIDFGDIESQQTKSACWHLTTSLMGTFYNYSATFENINPLGDPQLSLLDKLTYHELIHLVRIEDSRDELDDFLVNDKTDLNGMPDRVFSSANGTYVEKVSVANLTEMNVYYFTRSNFKAYIVINLHVSVENTSIWHYVRVENNITRPMPSTSQYLINAKRHDCQDLLLEKNVWQTTHILDTFYIHIFDKSRINSTDTAESMFVYNLTYGPRNMYPPKFNSTFYSVIVAPNTGIGNLLLKLEAYDLDKDMFMFAIENTSLEQLFAINAESGNIYLAQKLSRDHYEFEVVVRDYGIPPRSSSAKVSVLATNDSVNSTTAISTSMSTLSSTISLNISTSVRSSTSSSTDKVTMPTSPQSSTRKRVSRETSPTLSVESSTEMAEKEGQDGVPPWVIPTSIGLVTLLIFVLLIALAIFIYRRNRRHAVPRMHSKLHEHDSETHMNTFRVQD